MKHDFTSIRDVSFKAHLDTKNTFIFESVINSDTMKEFELLLKNYELTQENIQLKNRKKLSNFIKYRAKKILK